MWSDCEKTENAVSLTGSWLKSPFWITVVVVIVVISHQTSRKICTVVTWRRVGDMPCHPHQYSSAFLTSPSRRGAARCGAWSSFPGLLHHHLHRCRRRRNRHLRCLSCGILLAGCPSASNEAFFSAERIFRGRKLFAAAFSGLIGFVPPFSASSSSSPNSHLLANTHTRTLTQSHTKSQEEENILHIHKLSMKNHNSPLPNY